MTDNQQAAEEIVEARRAARRQIVFGSAHGCNNDLADDIFARAWDAALAAARPLIEAETREKAAALCQCDDCCDAIRSMGGAG